MSELIANLRFALRGLARSPGLTAVVIGTLALGVGANSVIFSFVAAILIEPLPYPEADRLVYLESVRGGETGRISLREITDVQERSSVFLDVAAHGLGNGGYNLSGQGRPEEIPALLCSRNLFSVLGVGLEIGGPWPAENDRLRNHSVVLGYDLWQRRWGGSADAIDDILTLDGADLYRVYGVAPRGFDYPFGASIYRSIAFIDLDHEDRGGRFYRGLGRLRDDVSTQAAQSELDRIAAELAQEFPDSNEGISYRLTPLKEHYVGQARPYLVFLLATVLLVLALACTNVANVLLARALDKEHEFALRRALGAGTGHLVRRWLAEGLCLGLLGGALAVAVATVGVPLLRGRLGLDLPRWMEITVDARVLLFAFVLALGAGLATVVVPAWQVNRLRLTAALAGVSRGATAAGHRRKTHGFLVAAQAALALILLVSAGFTIKSFRALDRADLGFETDDLLTFRVNLGWRAYDEADKTRNYYRQLLDGLAVLPGVEAVATNSDVPFGGVVQQSNVTLVGQAAAEQRENPYVRRSVVSPGYFQMMGIPLLVGRGFEESRALEGTPYAIVGRRAAETLWPGLDPIGQRLKLGDVDSQRPWLEVRGVVADVHRDRPDGEPGLDVYVSLFERPDHNAFVLARTSVPPMSLLDEAEEVALAIDPDQSIWDPDTMAARVSESFWRQRMAGTLVGMFAVLAILLAAVGIYGAASHSVSLRRREIGIRMALGASNRRVLWQVVGDSLRPVVQGGALGLVAAVILARLFQSLLYGTGFSDALILAAAVAVLLVPAVLASWIPARRAALLDPITVLTREG